MESRTVIEVANKHNGKKSWALSLLYIEVSAMQMKFQKRWPTKFLRKIFLNYNLSCLTHELLFLYLNLLLRKPLVQWFSSFFDIPSLPWLPPHYEFSITIISHSQFYILNKIQKIVLLFCFAWRWLLLILQSAFIFHLFIPLYNFIYSFCSLPLLFIYSLHSTSYVQGIDMLEIWQRTIMFNVCDPDNSHKHYSI